jgi:hypothetical protein
MTRIHSVWPASIHVNRRRLIQVGGLSLFGLGLPQLLQARDSGVPGTGSSAKSCIFVLLSGGLSQIDTLDPKPEAPSEIRGPYQSIATSVPGVQVTEMLPRLATLADRYCLIRSMSHADTNHVSAAHTMLTGQPDGRASNNSPFIGSLIAKLRPSTNNLPSHIWLHNTKLGTNKVPRYESGLNLIGHQYAPLRIGHELDNPAAPGFRVSAFDPPDGVSNDRLRERFRTLEQIESGSSAARGTRGQDFQSYQERALDLITGPLARRAFNLELEDERVRDRYGRHPLGQYLLMARRLIEAEVRLVTVEAWPGLAPGETVPTVVQVWDMHDEYYKPGETMYGDGPFGMSWSLPRLDQALSALLEDLQTRGLLEETLVVVAGEFGRSPKFEGKGRGRGHWSSCYTAMLVGGGILGGLVHGASDRQGAHVLSGRPITHEDFAATLFHALGISPDTRYGADGLSFRVCPGEPVRELFG